MVEIIPGGITGMVSTAVGPVVLAFYCLVT